MFRTLCLLLLLGEKRKGFDPRIAMSSASRFARPAGHSYAPMASPTSKSPLGRQKQSSLRGGATSVAASPQSQRVAAPPSSHSFTIALRAQWSFIVQQLKATQQHQQSSPQRGEVSRLAVSSGLDKEIARVLAAIRSDVLRAAQEAEELLPLLMALSIAPLPTESTQSLASEVLAKVLVVVSKTAHPKVMEGFIVQHKVLAALELALNSATSAEIMTGLLELLFAVVTVSASAATELLGNPGLVKFLLASLPGAVVAAHVCYIGAILQTLCRLRDAPSILCSYSTHHKLLSYLYEMLHVTDDPPQASATATSVSIIMRAVLLLVKGSSLSFRSLMSQPPFFRVLTSLLESSWADWASLACLMCSELLGEAFHGSNASEDSRKFLDLFLGTLVLATDEGSAYRRPPQQGCALLTVVHLICAEETRLSAAAAQALFSAATRHPQRVSELVFASTTAVHNLLTAVLEPPHLLPSSPSVPANKDSHNDAHAAEKKGLRITGALSAVSLCVLLMYGTARGRLDFSKHIAGRFSQTTKREMIANVREMLTSDLHLSFFRALYVDGVKASRVAQSKSSRRKALRIRHSDNDNGLDSDEDAEEERIRQQDRSIDGEGDDVWVNADHLRGELLRCITECLSVDEDRNPPRHGSDSLLGQNTQVASSNRKVHEKQRDDVNLVRDEPRLNIHSSHFFHQSIRVVVQLASHYAHSSTSGGQALGVAATTHTVGGDNSTSEARSSSQKRRHFYSPSSGTKNHNAWAPPQKHQVGRVWTISDLSRSDLFLFDCPLESITPGLDDTIEGLIAHVAKLSHELRLTSMSFPLRRCVLQDLYLNVYPTMTHCLQFLSQELGGNQTAVRTLLEGSHSVNSANVLDLYHAVGIASSRGSVHNR